MTKLTLEPSDKWSQRFIIAAIIQGAGIVGLTAFLIIGQVSFMKPEVSRVMAAGGAGTWFMFGYIIYLVVAVLGVAVSAIFYQFLGRAILSILAWSHLILMNAGTTAAAGLMMYSGYIGGAAALPANMGGLDFNPSQVHELIIPYVEPIAISILIIIIGTLMGGVAFIMAYRKVSKASG